MSCSGFRPVREAHRPSQPLAGRFAPLPADLCALAQSRVGGRCSKLHSLFRQVEDMPEQLWGKAEDEVRSATVKEAPDQVEDSLLCTVISSAHFKLSQNSKEHQSTAEWRSAALELLTSRTRQACRAASQPGTSS